MRYHVVRNGQVYGPYTLEDLHRYVASGHVLPTDSVKSDEMPDWIPASTLLGDSFPSSSGATQPGTPPGAGPAPYNGPVPPAYGPPAFAPHPFAGYGTNPSLPGPPNLSWGLVLLFDIVTFSLFQLIWNLVLAVWFRRVVPPTKVLLLYAAAAVLIFAQGAFGQTIEATPAMASSLLPAGSSASSPASPSAATLNATTTPWNRSASKSILSSPSSLAAFTCNPL